MTFKLAFAFLGLLFGCHIQFGFCGGKGDKVYQEPRCSSEGGICLKKENCGDDPIPKLGLCPKQSKEGVECCYIIIGPNQTVPSGPQENCGTRGAVCQPRCPDNLLDPTGLCVEGYRCCVAV